MRRAGTGLWRRTDGRQRRFDAVASETQDFATRENKKRRKRIIKCKERALRTEALASASPAEAFRGPGRMEGAGTLTGVVAVAGAPHV